MNLIDQLIQMQESGKSVVSITFILNRLGSIERHECEYCTQIPVYEMSAIRKLLQGVKRGGEP